MWMATISSRSYKKYQRQQRKVIDEPIFGKGMTYSDNPLDSGHCRLLVNHIQKDGGQRVRPRGGWRLINDPVLLGSNMPDMYIHHTGVTFVKDTVNDRTLLRRYALAVPKVTHPDYGTMEHSRVLVEVPYDPANPDPEAYKGLLAVSMPASGASNWNIKHDARKELVKVHDMQVMYPSPVGLHASIEGNTYMVTPDGLVRLEVEFNGTAYTHRAVLVTPKAISPGTAVDSGYNMLLDNPYTFNNNDIGGLDITGILPYNSSTGNLNLNMKVGERVKFEMFYDYAASAEYKVRWEIQDTTRETRDVIQTQQASPIYVDGASIYINTTVQYKNFSVIATVYSTADLDNPIQAMQAAFYNLDQKSAMNNPTKYDLMTAEGITVWKNQMVYWGVKGAEMSIFISDVNDPTYVPFPQNSILFNERVINCHTYMDSLYVETDKTMFVVDFSETGGFTYRPVQANMHLDKGDILSIFSVRNMVSFKSKDYYFLIVPNLKTLNGDLQVAPISTQITHFLDAFKPSVVQILRNLYELEKLLDSPLANIGIDLYDFYSFLDGSRIRHVYKLLIDAGTASPDDWYYVDFHLVYDTITRSWTTEVVESTRRPFHVFQAMATGYAQFISLVNDGVDTYAQWTTVDETNVTDAFMLGDNFTRTFLNEQMLDTGKRDVDGNTKKRYRQMILEINNLSDEDVHFHHLEYIDDQPRNDLYKYTTVQITDPEDPEYGRIYVERDLADTTFINGQATEPVTFYGETITGEWSLGNSMFPEQTVLKAHIDFSGKGYYPRVILITKNSQVYEINSVSWVYRDMNTK